MGKLSILICLLSQTALASLKLGQGAQYEMVSHGVSINMSVYITQIEQEKRGVEFYFSSNGFIPTKLWQQYLFDTSGSVVEVESAYVQNEQMDTPEKMPKKYFNANRALDLEKILFAKPLQIASYKIAEEDITTLTGRIRATHYQKKEGGSVINFWISAKVKPLGLIKLISENEKDQKQNYSVEFLGALIKAKAYIKPQEAVNLTTEGEKLLLKPIR